MICYVLDINGKPLMPIHRYGRVKKKLSTGKARLISKKPLTIRLTYKTETEIVDRCLIGTDPGRTNIGLCVIDSRGRVLYASDIETRNKAIAKLMLERKAHRQASRRGERKARQRLAVSTDKTGPAREAEFRRILPGCSEPVICKVIRNTEARFNNRKRPDGWLTPTARQLLKTHLNAIRLVAKILPVSGVVLELNKFAFMTMEDKNTHGIMYQNGQLKGFKDVNDAVDSLQDGRCLMCGGKIEHHHHVVPKIKGGSNTVTNIAGLCKDCHHKVHTDPEYAKRLSELHTGMLMKYGALSVLNQIIPSLLRELSAEYPVHVTNGWLTKKTRELYGLPKDHYIDGWCIAVSALDAPIGHPDFTDVFRVKQFRRHDRQIIHSQEERTYLLDGKIVAKNRKARTGQSDVRPDAAVQPDKKPPKPKYPSLQDYYLQQVKLYGKKNADRAVSVMHVKKSRRLYNNTGRMLPGAVFTVKEDSSKEYVMSGQCNHGSYYLADGIKNKYFPKKSVTVIKKNTGLVYI